MNHEDWGQLATENGTVEYGYEPAPPPFVGMDEGRPYRIIYYLEQRTFDRNVRRFAARDEMAAFVRSEWGEEV